MSLLLALTSAAPGAAASVTDAPDTAEAIAAAALVAAASADEAADTLAGAGAVAIVATLGGSANLVAADNFAGLAHLDDLDTRSPWVQVDTDGGVLRGAAGGGAVETQAAGLDALYRYDSGTWGNDQRVGMTVTLGGSNNACIGPAVRLSSDGDGYAYIVSEAGSGFLNRYTNGNYDTSLWADPTTRSSGDFIELEAIGTTLKVYVNGVEVHSTTDANYSSGKPGIAGYSNFTNNSYGDGWVAIDGSLTLTPPNEAADELAASAGATVGAAADLVEAGDAVSAAAGAVVTAQALIAEDGDTAAGAATLPIGAAAELHEQGDAAAGAGAVAIVAALGGAATAVTDDFGGLAAGADLSTRSPWTAHGAEGGTIVGAVGGGAVSPGDAAVGPPPSVSADGVYRYGDGDWGPDQWCEVTFTAVNGSAFVGPAVRLGPTGTGYAVIVNGSGAPFLNRYTNGEYAGVSWMSGSPTIASGSVVRLQVIGSTLKVFDDGVEIFSGTDTTHTEGHPGLAVFTAGDAGNVKLDNWSASDAPSAPPPAPEAGDALTASASVTTVVSAALAEADDASTGTIQAVVGATAALQEASDPSAASVAALIAAAMEAMERGDTVAADTPQEGVTSLSPQHAAWLEFLARAHGVVIGSPLVITATSDSDGTRTDGVLVQELVANLLTTLAGPSGAPDASALTAQQAGWLQAMVRKLGGIDPTMQGPSTITDGTFVQTIDVAGNVVTYERTS